MSIERILKDALNLIEADLKTIANVVESGEPLDPKEANKLTDYTKTLITAAKNEREVSKLEGLNNLSDDELEKLTREAINSLTEGDKWYTTK